MKFVLTEKRITELLAAEAELAALNMGGVDNWEWYETSARMFFDEVKRQTGEEYDDFESYARGIVEKERKKAKESLQKCDAFIDQDGGRCLGTKEIDLCDCKGKKINCTFY